MKTQSSNHQARTTFLSGAALLSLGLGAALGQTTPRATGLVPPTEEQRRWMSSNATRVQGVNFNALALQRINALRRSHNQSVMASAPVAFGDEVVAVGARAQSVGTTTVGLPASVDNSTLPSFPPIRNQEGIGSCACFSSAYYMGTHMMGMARGLNNKNNADNSTKLSPKWVYNMINGGNDSGSWFTAVFAVMLKNGVASWADFPYSGDASNARNYREWSTDAAVWRRALGNRFLATGEVASLGTATGVNNLKSLLNNGYVLVFATDVNGWQYKTISNDPATTADNALAGKRVCHVAKVHTSGHAMTVVGYNDDLWADLNSNNRVDAGEKGAFRIANSWGTTWEDAGFTWISYDALKATSAVTGADNQNRKAAWWESKAWYVTARASYTPSLVAQFTLNTARRDQMNIQVGRSVATATTPSVSWTSGALINQGGAFAFNGTTTAVNGSFAIDLTDIYQAGNLRYYARIADNAAGSACAISDFRFTNAAGTTLSGAATGVPASADARTIFAYASNGTRPSPTPTPTPTPADDHGNTMETATVASLTGTKNGVLELASDLDLFRLNVTATTTVTCASSSSIDTTGTLYNSAGTQIAFNDDFNGSRNFSITSQLTAGTYYLGVRSYNGSAAGSYSVTFSSTQPGSAAMAVLGRSGASIVDGDTTPVSTDGTAFDTVSTSGTVRSQVFTVRNSGNAALNLTGSPAVAITGTSASQFRVSILPVTSISAGSSTTFTIEYAPSATGTHDATVSITSNDSNTSPYQFAIRGSASFTSSDDHGNSRTIATSVNRFTTVNGNLESNGDVDYFRLVLTATVTVTIQTTGDTDTYGYLENASGQVLAYDDDAGAGLNFGLSRQLTAGTYYIRVVGYDSATRGAYSLRVD